jgi:pimeloyl-ACP methyl ester carboxylesterase
LARSCAIVSLASVAACAGPKDLSSHIEWSGGLTAGWRHELFVTPDFVLAGLVKQAAGGAETVVVYIEGDGRAWPGRASPPRDPTPETAVGLALAARDPHPAIVYLARPCQYTTARTGIGCAPRYWTSHRFAPEVVAAFDVAVDRAKTSFGAKDVFLVGFSGGGVIAVLLAARRDDIRGLITVASPLDHAVWTSRKGLSPLRGSLNPIDDARALRRVRQRHYIGANDNVVPADAVRAFLARIGDTSADPSHIEMRIVTGFGHTCCWADAWPGLLAEWPDR